MPARIFRVVVPVLLPRMNLLACALAVLHPMPHVAFLALQADDTLLPHDNPRRFPIDCLITLSQPTLILEHIARSHSDSGRVNPAFS